MLAFGKGCPLDPVTVVVDCHRPGARAGRDCATADNGAKRRAAAINLRMHPE